MYRKASEASQILLQTQNLWFHKINIFNSNLLPILINSAFINKKIIPVSLETALNFVT